jgi:phosphoribosylaminoimidazole carboxylase (NCAIR synthetase)
MHNIMRARSLAPLVLEFRHLPTYSLARDIDYNRARTRARVEKIKLDMATFWSVDNRTHAQVIHRSELGLRGHSGGWRGRGRKRYAEHRRTSDAGKHGGRGCGDDSHEGCGEG